MRTALGLHRGCARISMLEEFPVETRASRRMAAPAQPVLEGFVPETGVHSAPVNRQTAADSTPPPVPPRSLNSRLTAAAAVSVVLSAFAIAKFGDLMPVASAPPEPGAIRSATSQQTAPAPAVSEAPQLEVLIPPSPAATTGTADRAAALDAEDASDTAVAPDPSPIALPATQPLPAAPLPKEETRSAQAPPVTSAPLVLEPLREAPSFTDVGISPVEREAPPPAVRASPVPAADVRPAVGETSRVLPRLTDERPAIESVLTLYRSGYGDLDARAVKQIWPGASEAALARAFAALDSQSIAFYNCDISVSAPTARARCDGQVSYVGRVGPRQARTQNREWTFALRQTAGRWEIEQVQVR